MKQRVGIIGGGFIGTALAQSLNKDKYDVTLSYRSNKPESTILGVDYDFCDVERNSIIGGEALFKVDSLIVCIPPGFKKDMGDSYTPRIKTIINQAQNSKVKQVVFTSSIGIYSKAGINDENAELDMSVNKVKVLYDAEQAVLNSRLQYKQVLRLGGLIGGNRQPGNFKVVITKDNANEPVNMVMQEDVVGAITCLIDDALSPSQTESAQSQHKAVYNVVSPHHPNKQSFYRYARQQANTLTNSEIVGNPNNVEGRLVKGDLITKALNFKYKHDNFFESFTTNVV
ncbi:NAD(P)H-binding protein [Psychrosphaera sp.]|nr:NAD(P)H-binding protein [Psychrosphaera sp.]